jgi:glucose/arabinose dehydrogenase
LKQHNAILNTTLSQNSIRILLACLPVLACGFAQADNLLLNDFKNKDSVSGLWKMWGGASQDISWSSDDAGGDVNSGSLKLKIGFDQMLDDNQYAIGMALAGGFKENKALIASSGNYAKLAFDVRWNTESTVSLDDYNNSGGDPGFHLGLATEDWGKTWLEGVKLEKKKGWQHVEVTIPVGVEDFTGLIFKKWTPGGGDEKAISGTASISIDNIQLIAVDDSVKRPVVEITKKSLSSMKVEKIYSALCAQCHGARLEGGLAPTLLDGVWKHGSTDAELAHIIKKGNLEFGMTPWEHLISDTQIHALVVFLREKEGEALSKGITYPKPEPGKITKTDRADYKIEYIVEEGLKKPWAIAFLPDGRRLVTEHAGSLRIISAGDELQSELIKGTPRSIQHGQGGMMEVAVHPDYKQNGWIYLGFADGWLEKVEGKDNKGKAKKDKAHTITAVVRGRIKDNEFYGDQGYHFGTRIVFDQGYIYFIVGERGGMTQVQELNNPKGKIFRLYDDGREPDDNPFVDQSGAIKGIWTYGHRNPQGLAIDPRNGAIFSTEHGPRGGDELNLILKGHNYGWPIITHGMNYDGTPMTRDSKTHQEGMDQPVTYWVPSIATCGLDFYSGEKFPGWKNDLFVGALKKQEVRRLRVIDGKVTEQEIILKDIGRVRDVAMGPDGNLYVVLNGPDQIIRLIPAK